MARQQRPVEATELNLGEALRTHPDLHAGAMLALDTFSGQTLLMRPIPRPGVPPPPGPWVPSAVTDIEITHLIEWFQANRYIKVSRGRVDHAVDAEGARNKFSAAKDVLDALAPWDGVARLDSFWIRVCGADATPPGATEDEVFRKLRYLNVTARCFFIGIVARIIGVVTRTLEPGVKVDTMPILEGPQGSLKSTLLRVIALDREAWFSDSMIADLANKDARQHLSGKLIIEMAEMSQMKASKAESMKAFLSAQDDKFRPSYGRRDVVHKRQCVFAGTTNSDDYLIDMTGNRRFWPIACGRIDIPLAREQMPQLYAEAITAYGDGSGDNIRGEQWWLPDDVETIAAEEQRQRMEDDPWLSKAKFVYDEALRVAVGAGSHEFFITTDQVLVEAEKNHGMWDKAKQMRAAGCLVKLGGKRMKLPRNQGWPRNGYKFGVPTIDGYK